jgi:putative DNA primase/helicase
MIRAAEKAGVYAGDDRIRGRGAWLDDGRSVMHLGDRLLVNGESVDVMNHGSKFIYEAARPFPVKTDRIATNVEAHKLLDICREIRWEQPISAYLLAGWVVTAPVCGILRWRPHIWITGPAGSGKSTVVDRIVKPMISHVGECVAGATSEAGIRQTILRGDARPVVLDEAEPKDPAAQARIKSILDLARVASTGGKLQKGTADQHGREYTVRAMFAFASINPAVEGFADESRVTQLAITPNESRDDEDKSRNVEHFESLMRRINDTISPDFADAVLMRTLQHLETLRDNVDTFANAAATHLGNMRLGDQIAPMLAGCYLLHSTARISFDAALEWVRKRDWSQHTATGAARDCDRLLQFLMQYQIRFHAGNGGQDSRTLGELLGAAVAKTESVIPQDAAYESILRWGIKPTKDDGVEISTTHNAIKRALQGTEWALGWRRALAAIEGAKPIRAVRFGPGSSTPAIWIPISHVLDP